MGKMVLQRFRLLCIFLFVTMLVIYGPSTTYADDADEPEHEPEPCPSVFPTPTISPIPTPPLAPTPSEDDD